MVQTETRVSLSNNLSKKLENNVCPVGFVAGYVRDGVSCCLDCSNTSSYFLTGLDIVAHYCHLLNAPTCDSDLLSFAKQNLVNEFQVRGDDALVLFLYKNDEFKSSELQISAKMYSSYYCTMVGVTIIEKNLDTSNCLLFRALGKFPLIFEGSTDKSMQHENLELAIEKTKALFQSKISVFFAENSRTFLRHSVHDNSLNITSKEFLKKHKDDSNKEKSKYQTSKKDPFSFKILLQTTGEIASENVNHSLVIHSQRRHFICISMHLPIDVLIVALNETPMQEIYDLFTKAITNRLENLKIALQEHCKGTIFPTLEVCHFFPQDFEFPLSLIYPEELSDKELEPLRRKLHKQLLLPSDRPYLRKTNRYFFSENEENTGHLINPHDSISTSFPEGTEIATVYGKYAYHHYMQDYVNDDGWGCAYRSLQTIISWFRMQGYVEKNVPTHKEIQQALVDIGDKPKTFVGSKQWIGSQEVSFCLNELIGVTSKIIFVSSGSELETKASDLLHHFRSNGTPIMIGGGVLAHTILGVSFDRNSGEVKFLILDPHYTGSEDLTNVLTKGWCGWKGVQFWDKTAYYNLCLPQRPFEI